MAEYSKDECILLLQKKYDDTQKYGRYPRRSDFSEREVMAIKANFGPWPRALECAGIKEPRADNKKELNREKRARAKRRRRESEN